MFFFPEFTLKSDTTMQEDEDFEHFLHLLVQSYSGTTEKINNANVELDDLYSENTSYCLFLASRAILQNGNNENISVVSLSFIKSATSPRRRFGILNIKSIWESEDFTPIRESIKQAIILSINSSSILVRNMGSVVLAQVLRIEGDKWYDIFNTILNVATDERGETGRLCVITILQEILNLDLKINFTQFQHFFSLVSYSLHEDSEAAIPGMKVLCSLIKQFPNYFIIAEPDTLEVSNMEKLDEVFLIIAHFIESPESDIVLHASLIMTEIMKTCYPFHQFFMQDKILELINTLLSKEDPSMAVYGAYSLMLFKLEAPTKIVQQTLSNYVQFVPVLLYSLKREPEEPENLSKKDRIHAVITIALQAFWEADSSEMLPYIVEFFHENVNDSSNLTEKYAGYLSVVATCSSRDPSPLENSESYQSFILEVIESINIVGHEGELLLVYTMLGLIPLVIPKITTQIAQDGIFFMIYNLCINALQLRDSRISIKVFDILSTVIQYVPQSYILQWWNNFYDIILPAMDQQFGYDSTTMPFVAMEYLVDASSEAQNEKLAELAAHSFEVISEFMQNTVDRPDGMQNKAIGYLRVLKKIVDQCPIENLIENVKSIVLMLLKASRNNDLQSDAFPALESCLKKIDTNIMMEFMDPIIVLLKEFLRSMNPTEIKLAAHMYGVFFECFKTDALDYLGEDFNMMLQQVENFGEDPFELAPAFLRTIGTVLSSLQRTTPIEIIENFFHVMEELFSIYVNKNSKVEVEYACNLYNGLVAGIKGVAQAVSDDIIQDLGFRKSLKTLIDKIINAIINFRDKNVSEELILQFVAENDGLIYILLSDRLKSKMTTFLHSCGLKFIEYADEKFDDFNHPEMKEQIRKARTLINSH